MGPFAILVSQQLRYKFCQSGLLQVREVREVREKSGEMKGGQGSQGRVREMRIFSKKSGKFGVVAILCKNFNQYRLLKMFPNFFRAPPTRKKSGKKLESVRESQGKVREFHNWNLVTTLQI